MMDAGMERTSDDRVEDPVVSIPLTNDVSWIAEAFPLPDGRLEHVSVYLIRTDEGFIIVDSGSFHDRESIRDRITRTTEGEGIRAMILSHSDYPHSGNIPDFREIWGDFEIVASCGDPGIQGLPYATRSRIGGSTDVLGRTFRFIDPPLADRSHTSWIYDTVSRVMFAADGFGCYHAAGETDQTSRDYGNGIPKASILDFHRDTLVWLRYVDPPVLFETLDRMFDEHPVSWVAPIHGAPIAAADLPDYMAKLRAAVETISSSYQVRI